MQAAHAVLQSAYVDRELPPTHPNIIVVGVDNEAELLTASQLLEDKNIKHVLFREPDLGDCATAIATFAIFSSKDRRIFRHYKLI